MQTSPVASAVFPLREKPALGVNFLSFSHQLADGVMTSFAFLLDTLKCA